MTRKKARHMLARRLRATGAPMAVAAKAAKIAARICGISVYDVGRILGGYSSEGQEALQALGFRAEGHWRQCCSDPMDGDVWEPLGVFFAPEMRTEELIDSLGDRTLLTTYPSGTRTVPISEKGIIV